MKRNICLMLVLLLPVMAAQAVDRYVATNGTHDGAFTNWAGAATNIQAAVDVATNAGDYVYVSNGVYSTTNGVIAGSGTAAATNTVVAMTNANIITLKSVNGPLVTIIDAGGVAAVWKHRGVYIKSGGTIDGFTVRNGYLPLSGPYFRGAGICLESPGGGTVTNCIVHDNYIGYGNGGGIYIGDSCLGKIDNCLIYSNSALNGGGGVSVYWSSGGTRLNNSVIWGNKVPAVGWPSVSGGGIGVGGASLSMRNCLVYSNSVLTGGSSTLGGGGLYLSAGNVSIENCTITENTTDSKAGGIYIGVNNGFVRNSIIYNNFTTNVSVYPDVYTTNNQLTNCCFGDTNGIPNWNINGNITNNPVFVDATSYNYRLTPSSPCVNTGTNQSWMFNAVDLDGQPRIRYGIVDRGAFERLHKGTIYSIR